MRARQRTGRASSTRSRCMTTTSRSVLSPSIASCRALTRALQTFGSPTSSAFRKAQDAFVKSLASYSVICYLLQLKDRHNGNILVDREGHLIRASLRSCPCLVSCPRRRCQNLELTYVSLHADIDFGFLLSNSPGSLGFEMAPFKLPQDYIDILGGFDSPVFAEFKALFKRAFRDARKHAERIITVVELMQKGALRYGHMGKRDCELTV
jgi:phosphatidylinositol kinase/protein kinase (PI-3  family)